MYKKIISIFTMLFLLFVMPTNAYAAESGMFKILVNITGLDTKVSPSGTINIYDKDDNLVITRDYDMNWINSEYRGSEMPEDISNRFNLPVGDYKVEIQAAYFDNYMRTVNVTTGSAVTYNCPITRKMGSLKVKVIGRDVLGTIDGEYKPVATDFEDPTVTNSVFRQGYNFNLSDDLDQEVTVYLERERINPQPERLLEGAKVWINGPAADYGEYSMGYGTGDWGAVDYTDENGEIKAADCDVTFLNYVNGNNEVFSSDPSVYGTIYVAPPEDIVGSLKIKYINEKTGGMLEAATIKSNLELGTYTESAKEFDGYRLHDDNMKSATLTRSQPNQTIIFNYTKSVIAPIIKGTTIIQYINEDTGALLQDETVNSNLNLGTYTYTAKKFDGFTLNDDNIKSTTLTESQPNQTVIFKYKKKSSPSSHKSNNKKEQFIPPVEPIEPEKIISEPEPVIHEPVIEKNIKGSYTVRHIYESEDSVVVLDENDYNDLPLGQYSELSKSFDGYVLNDYTEKYILLNENNTNGTIEFRYDKVPYKIPTKLPQTGDNSRMKSIKVLMILAGLSSMLLILKKKQI